MTKAEIATIKNVIERLRGERAAPEVKAALTGPAGPFLEAWVISALELLLPGDKRDPSLAARLSE